MEDILLLFPVPDDEFNVSKLGVKVGDLNTLFTLGVGVVGFKAFSILVVGVVVFKKFSTTGLGVVDFKTFWVLTSRANMYALLTLSTFPWKCVGRNEKQSKKRYIK